MTLADTCPMTELNRVEISGWDVDEMFFVERAEVDWDESGEQIHIRMNRTLRMGAVIFLRQMAGMIGSQSYPLAYSVEPMGANENGVCEYRLTPVRSRTKPFSLGQAKGVH